MMKSFEAMTLAEWDDVLPRQPARRRARLQAVPRSHENTGRRQHHQRFIEHRCHGLRAGIGLLRLQIRDRGLQPRAGAGAAAAQHRRQHHHPRQAARRRNDQADLADAGAVRRAGPAEHRVGPMQSILTKAFVFLARRHGDGVTGQRVPAFQLSEQIRREG